MQDLRDVRSLSSVPWLVAEDFSLIYQAADKNNLNQAMMERFRRILYDTQIKELPFMGRMYTWSNERSSPTLVRLHRVFCYSDWDELFPDSLLQSAASLVSDHCPPLVGFEGEDLREKAFPF